MLARGKTGFIGIDISDYSLEAVQLTGQYGKSSFRLRSWSRAVIQPGVMKSGRIVKPDEFAESVRGLLSKPSFGSMEGKQIVCSVLEHHCYHFVIAVSKWASDKSVFTQIQEGLNGRIPFSLTDVYWDWRPVREDSRMIYVYAVAVPKEVLDEYRQAFQALGMNMIYAEPQVLCAARSLWPKLVTDAPRVVIDIGTRETSISTVDDFGVHQSSVVPVGASHWTEALMKQLSLQPVMAEKILRTLGMRRVKHPNAEVIQGILEKGLAPIVAEATQHMTFYNAQTHIEPGVVKELIVIGGGAAVPGVSEYLGHKLSLGLAAQKSWYELKPPLGPIEQLLLTNALGAALRGLMDGEQQTQELNLFSTRRQLTEIKTSGWQKFRRFLGTKSS